MRCLEVHPLPQVILPVLLCNVLLLRCCFTTVRQTDRCLKWGCLQGPRAAFGPQSHAALCWAAGQVVRVFRAQEYTLILRHRGMAPGGSTVHVLDGQVGLAIA